MTPNISGQTAITTREKARMDEAATPTQKLAQQTA